MQATATAEATATAVSTKDVATIYGRLTEKQLFLDKNVGACCHSACSDCEWRMPDGGYRFDLLKANNPKWLPTYLSRDFEDERGCHTPVWSSELFPDGAGSTVGRAEFAERLAAMPFEMPMGPKGIIKPDAAEPSPEVLDLFWEYLGGGDELEAEATLRRLQDMSLAEDREGAIGEGPDFVDWKSFAKALGVGPFERW